MECNRDFIKNHLLNLKKIELVEFIVNRRLPETLQKISVVMEFLLINECRICRRCTADEIVPIEFYSCAEAVDDSSLKKTEYDCEKLSQTWVDTESTMMNFTLSTKNVINEVKKRHSPLQCISSNEELKQEYIDELSFSEITKGEVDENFEPQCVLEDIKEENIDELSSTEIIEGVIDENLQSQCVSINEELEENIHKYYNPIEITELEVNENSLSHSLGKRVYNSTNLMIKHTTGAKPYACRLCHKRYTCKKTLKVHACNHFNKPKLFCNVCNFRTINKGILSTHLNSHKKQEFKCKMCGHECNNQLAFAKHICASQDLKFHIESVNGEEKPFKCDLCDYKYSTIDLLKLHHQNVHGNEMALLCEKSFKCDLCNYKYSTEALLELHHRTNHRGARTLKCDLCRYRTEIDYKFKRHMQLHTPGKRLLNCSYCDFQSYVKYIMGRHLKTHNKEPQYACTLCEYKASVKSDLKLHMTTHAIEKLSCSLCNFKCIKKEFLDDHLASHTLLYCATCDYKTLKRKNLARHMKIHNQASFLQCEVCGCKCSNMAALVTHRRGHTGEKPFKCNICDYKCTLKSTLNLHVRRVHLAEKGESCDFCNYKCFSKVGMRLHQRVHTGEKPYSCSICDFKTSLGEILKRHMRTHTGEKPFGCESCSYKTSSKYNLKTHMRVHTGEKPFCCKLCDFKSRYQGELKKHLQKHNELQTVVTV